MPVLLFKGQLRGVVLLNLLDCERQAYEHVARQLTMLRRSTNLFSSSFLHLSQAGNGTHLPRNLDLACAF